MYKIHSRTKCKTLCIVIRSPKYGLRFSSTKVSPAKFSSAKFENPPFDLHKLDSGPATSVELTKEDGMTFLRTMQLLRKMEREISVLYKNKLIRGFCHLYSGQEAVGVGIRTMLSPKDTVIGSYRCHAWVYLMGITIEAVVAELLGKITGCARSKGGSMHMYGPSMYGGNSIVGAHIPLGTGIAFAHKYKNDGGVCVTVFGDGAINQGQVYESMNLAKLHSVPALFVVENNVYAMGTAITRHSANPDLYTRGDAVPGLRMDGMDVLAVREGTKFCLDYIRSGKGPIILELLTYRYFGHSMSDPGTSYRTREEIQKIRESKDPIMLLRSKLVTSNLATEEEVKQVDKETTDEVKKAVEEALKAKEVDPAEVAYDIYCNFTGQIRMPGFGKYLAHKNSGAYYDACKS